MLKSGTKNFGIIEAIKELKEISLSDRLRYEHEMRLKAKRDRRAEDKYVYNQGHKAGIEIGKQQGIEIGKSQGIEIGEERGIEIGKSQGIEIGKQQSLRIFINYMRKNGLSDEHIVKELMAEYGLSCEDAVEAIH